MIEPIKKQAVSSMLLAITLLVLSGGTISAAGKPLKIYIMAGQSNMVGYGAVSSFDYIGDDPKTAPLLKLMRGADGKPAVGERVWISSFTGKMNQQAHEYVGKLRVGLGGRRDHSELGDCIGPEYPFGLVMEQAYDGPILIIKTAWGGQSLCVHYRPPGAGPYEPVESEKAAWANPEKTREKLAEISKESGQNYRWMMGHVKKVLADIKRVYPDYDEKQGYELAGFVWFQGWNDYISGHHRKDDVIDRLIALLGAPDLYTQYGACQAITMLGERGKPAIRPLLTTFGSDDLWLRILSAEALAGIGEPAKAAVPDMLTRITKSDPRNDPRNMEQRYLSVTLFDTRRGLIGQSLEGVDRNLLFKAVRAGLQNEDGHARG